MNEAHIKAYRHPDRYAPPQVAKCLRRFEDAWQEATAPAIDRFALPTGDSHHLDSLRRLVALDQKYRWKSGVGVELEDYFRAWPVLSEPLEMAVELLKSECLWRATYGEMPDRDALTRRFPTFVRAIDISQLASLAETMRLRESYFGSGRFFIVGLVGEGGMGKVYSAWDRERRGLVALKVLPRLTPDSLLQFKNEFRSLTEISHPNLAGYYELLSVSDQWFFTMELIEGVSFRDYVRSHACPPSTVFWAGDRTDKESEEAAAHDAAARPPTRLDADLTVLRSVLGQLADGICALHHAGKLHRDLKPSNVLIREGKHVVVLDFGLVTEVAPETQSEDREITDSGVRLDDTDPAMVGTIAYMSPEQAAGRKLTEASDWYSFGVMLYEALTRQRPFGGDRRHMLEAKKSQDPVPPGEICDGVPDDLNALCLDLLQRDPHRRPAGSEVIARLGDRRETVSAEHEVPPQPQVGPFVGRRDELSALHAAFRDISQGAALIVHVAGVSGVGKSRLVQHFLQELAADAQVVILPGRCYECESVPYKALDTIIDSLSRHLRSMDRSEVEALLPKDIAALARVFPVLQRVPSVRRAPQKIVDMPDLQALRRRAFGALRHLLQRIGDRKKLVLHIDDLHWGDSDSAAVLTELVRPPAPPRLLLLVSYRSEQAASSTCLESLRNTPEASLDSIPRRTIHVGPLTPQESQLLAGLLLKRDQNESAEYAQTIARESQGTPFFIYELAQYAEACKDVTQWKTSMVDFGLEDVLWRRVQHLSDDARRLLEIVAVASQPLSLRRIYEAASLDALEQRALASLRARHLVRTTGPRLEDDIEVYHDRVRESVLANLPAERRCKHQARLALTLEAAGGQDPETIATHYQGGGRIDKARHYYIQAADQAAEALAFERAARLYRLSLDLQPPTEQDDWTIRSKLARALADAGRGYEAAKEYQMAAIHCGEQDRFDFERRAAYQYLITGHFDDGRHALENVLGAVGMKLQRSPRTALLSLLVRRGWRRLRGLGFRERPPEQINQRLLARLDTCWSAAIGLGIIDIIRAADFQARGLNLAFRAGDPFRITRALALEAIHNAVGGSHTQHRTANLLQTAETVFRRAPAPYSKAILAMAQGATAWLEGRFLAARQSLVEAQETFRNHCTGVTWEIDSAQTYELFARINLGEFAELARIAPAVIRQARERGDLYLATNVNTYPMPLVLLCADEPGQAADTVSKAMGTWSEQEYCAQHMFACVSEVEIHLYLGEGLAAWQRITSEWPALVRSLHMRIQHARLHLLYSRARSALLASDRAAHSESLRKFAYRDARRLAREKRVWAHGLAAVILAGLATREGNTRGALTQLNHAARFFEAVDARLQASAARRCMGNMLGGDEGRTLVDQSDNWMTSQGIRAPARMAAALIPVEFSKR